MLTAMFLAHFDDELVERRAPTFQPRRNDLDRLTEQEFQQRTRLNFAAYRDLFAMIEPAISPKSWTNHAINPHTRIQMTLRYIAQGSMFLSNSDLYGVSKASMSIHVNKVFEAITEKVNITHLCSTNLE